MHAHKRGSVPHPRAAGATRAQRNAECLHRMVHHESRPRRPAMSPNAALRPEQSPILPVFSAPYAAPDEALAAALLANAPREAAAERRIDARATRLVEAIRAKSGGLGGIEDFLREYSLSTREGLALMVLAEALLRVPDAATADSLI